MTTEPRTGASIAAERTTNPNELVEMALTHTVKNKVTAAYRRRDMLDRRRSRLDDWAAFCAKIAPAAGNVAATRQAEAG